MIALDTNIIVRFLVRDDEKQSQSVYARFKQAEKDRETLLIPFLVLLETIWVLESAYDMHRNEILSALEDLRRMPILEFENEEILQRLLISGRNNKVDLDDLLIAFTAQDCGCDSMITFDRKALGYDFFRLLK